MKWIRIEIVLAIHDEQLAEHGGWSGVNLDLLESALQRPKDKIHYGNAQGVAELAAAYAFTSLQSFLDLYYATMAVLRCADDFADLAQGYLARAAAQGVRHAEIFFDPQAHLARGVPLAEVMRGLGEGLAAGGERFVGIASQMVALAAEGESVIRQAQGAPARIRVAATSTVADFERGELPPHGFGDRDRLAVEMVGRHPQRGALFVDRRVVV